MEVPEIQCSDDENDYGFDQEETIPDYEDDIIIEGSCYTCPICLCELAAIRNEGSDSEEVNQEGIPIFTLRSCNHRYCAPCLHAYVQSKLVGGDLEITCCHSHPTTTDEKEVDRCKAAITRCDIKRLIHMDYFRNKSFVGSDWVPGRRQSTAQDCNNEAASDDLWNKFKKLEFDRLYGKDAVRRCPTCDEAALFDVNSMKQHQSKFESISAQNNATSAATARQMNHRTRLGRFFRRRSRLSQNPNQTSPVVVAVTPPPASTIHDNSTNIARESDADDEEQPKRCESEAGVIKVEEETDDQVANGCLVKSKTPVITCSSCNTEFCYFHSNAHQGQSCLDYHSASLELDRANIEFANRVLQVKPCPNCGIAVSKEGGCNQIKCPSCNTHFCWLCSAIIDDSPFPDHFRWWNVNGCPNMQLDESVEPARAITAGARVLSIFQLLILGVPAVALSIASMLLCPCLVPGCGNNTRERVINCISFWGSFLSTIIVLPFTVLGLLLLASLNCFLVAISCCFKVPKNNNNGTVSRQEGDQVVRQPIPNNVGLQYSPEELIRELENIIVRLEEGSNREDVEVAAPTAGPETVDSIDL